VIMAAAVADFRPAETSKNKIKRLGTHCLNLEPNPDILAGLSKVKGDRFLVGFAAETDDLIANARGKMERKNLDMIVANDVTACGAGFCCDTNIIKIIERDGSVYDFPQMPKEQVAEVILDHVVAGRKKMKKEL